MNIHPCHTSFSADMSSRNLSPLDSGYGPMMAVLEGIQTSITEARRDIKRVENKVDGMIETQGLDATAGQEWREKHSDAVRDIKDQLSLAAKR